MSDAATTPPLMQPLRNFIMSHVPSMKAFTLPRAMFAAISSTSPIPSLTIAMSVMVLLLS